YDVPYALARAAAAGRKIDVNPPLTVVRERQRLANAMLAAAAQKYGAEILDPTPHFCDQSVCHAEIGGRSRYVDSDHITRTTSESLSDLFDGSFQRLRDFAPAANAAQGDTAQGDAGQGDTAQGNAGQGDAGQAAPIQASDPATPLQSSFAMPGKPPSQ
ncbi:MAG TPA: SGNH hydrolase domain-containing protein, partial [Terriglobales bacterium]|nr:SGNH hydrolase domain-containing protein [Terriglobales bacterium]